MKIWAIALRVLQGFRRDHRTLALVLVAPVLLLTLIWLVMGSESYQARIGAVDLPVGLRESIEEGGAYLEEFSKEEGEKQLRANAIDALFSIAEGTLVVEVEGSDPTANRAVRFLLLSIMQDQGKSLQPIMKLMMQNAPAGQLAPLLARPPRVDYLHGAEDVSAFDSMGPVLLGFLVFFFTFIVSGVSFVRERTTGTLERIMAAPVGYGEVVLGYGLGFSILVLAQSSIAAVWSVFVLNMAMEGPFLLLLLVTVLLALSALALGMFLSSFATSEFQVIQFIPLVIVPQFFFSGVFPLETLPDWLQAVARVLPVTYGAHALREVMARGAGFAQIQTDVLVLLACTAAFLFLNARALRRYRPE